MTISQMSSQQNSGIADELFGLSASEAFAADAATRLINELQKAYIEEHRDSKLTRSELARRMKTHRSQVTEILQGRRNITLRTLFEFVYCMDRDASFAFPSRSKLPVGCNQFQISETQTAPMLTVGNLVSSASGIEQRSKLLPNAGGNAAATAIAAE